MSTETNELRLTASLSKEKLSEKISQWEAKPPAVVSVRANAADLNEVRSALCALRASNLSSQLFLESNTQFDREQSRNILTHLHDWDQLSLHNLLLVCGRWIPASYLAALEQESKIEQQWIRQWLGAINDPRIAKVPGLPWRSFLRTVIRENFSFATELLGLVQKDSQSPVETPELESLLTNFLKKKKQVVCTFPKKWVKN